MEEAAVSNRSIHILTESQLKDRGNTVAVHWILGHKGFAENKLADSLAKETAKEMVDCQEVL